MMKLSSAAFNRHLNHMGQRFSWRPGYACPCVSRESGQPNPKCSHCSGKGRMWGDATDGIAGVVSQRRLRNYSTFGPWDKDDMMLSIGSDSPLYGLGQFDRIMSIDRSEPFSVALVRGLNDMIRFPVIELTRAFYIDAGDFIVDLDLPKINPDGTLDWGTSPPPANLSYSLSGRRPPEYFCYVELPTDRPQHSGEKLPRKVVLRRFDLFGR